MFKQSIFVVLGVLVAAQALAQVRVVSGSGGYGPKSPYVMAYSKGSVVELSGKVTGVVRSAPAQGMDASVSLLVKSGNGGVSVVEVGPTWYVDGQRVTYKTGDRVKVKGSKVMLGNRSVILAQRVTKNNRVLYLRGEDGWPMWLAYRGRITVMSNSPRPENVTVNGTIRSIRTVPLGNESNVFIDVATDAGTRTFNVGPVWFISRQDMVLEVGSVIVLTGGPARNGMMPVIDLRRGVEWMIIRDLFGRPVWNNFGGGD